MMYPFQTEEYRSLFKKHFCEGIGVLFGCTEYELVPENKAILIGMKPVLNGQEITDYGEVDDTLTLSEIHKSLHEDHSINIIQYDYIREGSPTFKKLSAISPVPAALQEVAPFISLPSSWESHLESLDRKDRKELKRKFKRLETTSYRFRYSTEKNATDFEEFIKLHKLSDVSKNKFMSDKMKSFFSDLYFLSIPGWQTKLAFLDIEGKPAAALFYFENEDEILLYNSGYDPAQKFYSAGLLLCADLIKQSIEQKKKTFDFLRGNERYKYDLGAKDHSLFQFVISFE